MAKVNVVFGCAGHYKTTSGKETPYIPSLKRRIKEWEFNEPVWQLLMQKLKKHGVLVYDCAPGERDVPLKERTDYANKMYWQLCSQYGKSNVNAIYISEHYDALDGTFEGSNPSGFTVFIYKGQTNKESGRLAKLIAEEQAKGTKQTNRGVKEADLHIVRETVMPAVLVENGFMDNPVEALYMLDQEFQEEVASEQERAILRYFGLPVTQSVPASTVKKEVEYIMDKAIVVNSLSDLGPAEVLRDKLKAPIVLGRDFVKGQKVAKEVYIVGGANEPSLGEKVTHFGGANRFDVAQNVRKFVGI